MIVKSVTGTLEEGEKGGRRESGGRGCKKIVPLVISSAATAKPFTQERL